MARFPYWIVPVFSATVWLAMLLAMLLWWIVAEDSPKYSTMSQGQTIAFISDVGARTTMKPLFIAMGTTAVVTFDLVFILERWLRHRGKLERNTSWTQRILSVVSIFTAIAGGVGLILLSIFDTLRHPTLHNAFLGLFIVGYIISAIATCAEYQRLGIHFRDAPILRISFWMKLTFILVSIGLAIAFGVTQRRDQWNAAAIVEWVVALVYDGYVFSFAIDFISTNRSRRGTWHEEERAPGTMSMAALEANNAGAIQAGSGRFYGNGTDGAANGYTNGTAGYANGYTTRQKPTEPVSSSRNF
ncbi:Frag1/DRAM/Sfk1 family-domain-containing protein [Lineolata rhizophorae]|uniref:Frag1/DRAM/Sfk1 family-domain-containing protein n=1 Tax=Lineolata rhizophorae TaxID=578093 RepID=A0A6A6NYH3_9PEZI|nr:Frag1/DRAM/Sfk1 family-domain-containing protein [Lineolata rhizophorae]